ncbi:MAG: hypothetical protein JST19_12515 [Bacteroidetes bacterium]|nr:hypothetical protein [Bacteroidota bacterium]
MNMNLKLILSSFIRQEDANDCGAACLRMIFNYSGLTADSPEFSQGEPISLFQLQQWANSAGLKAEAVRMDLENLRNINSPCILHILTDTMQPHYIVCFNYEPGDELYLIADPDGQVGFINESELNLRWQSRACIYFEDIRPKNGWRIHLYPWSYLLYFNFVPGILWFAVPLLNVCGSLLGLGATLVIEKAINPDFLNNGKGFMTMVFILLSFLSIAKCGLSYVKERLIINFAGELDGSLYLQFIRPLDMLSLSSGFLAKQFSDAMKDVQRVHQSVSMLVGSVASDGLMVMILLISLYFYFPLLVLIEALAVLTLLFLTNRQLPFLLITSRSRPFSPLLQINEYASNSTEGPRRLLADSIKTNAAISRRSLRVSTRANQLNLQFEAIAGINLVIVLIFNISALRSSAASYPEFVFGLILCFATINLATKICNQLFLVAQGAEMLGQRSKCHCSKP